MNADRLAMFLSTYTTGGFRRSLGISPHITQSKCGFDPGEAVQLAASLAKHRGDTYTLQQTSFAFQQIDVSSSQGSRTAKDDWRNP